MLAARPCTVSFVLSTPRTYFVRCICIQLRTFFSKQAGLWSDDDTVATVAAEYPQSTLTMKFQILFSNDKSSVSFRDGSLIGPQL